MADEINEKQAERVYETICEMFRDMDFTHTPHDEEMVVTCTVHGDDIPMDIAFYVFPKRQMVSLISLMPFKVPQDKRIDVALAVTTANYGIVDGSFDFDLGSGRIRFRMTESFRESIIGKAQFKYMLSAAASTIDLYNDKFLMMSKGYMSLDQFIDIEMNSMNDADSSDDTESSEED
ncbi:MAG TPA: hypothetical protein DCZ71_08100 [Ruminococcus sp.]|nr:hypothetical protein [Ruminococcus sp.]